MSKYDFKKIEKKWQKKWEEKKIFKVKEDSKKKKYYVLEMFPYPSGEGLHIGHSLNYTIGDIYSRFKRMSGFNVLYPMGYDALGLPAENAAIKAGVHPKKYTQKSIKNFMMQQHALGLSYDWSRMVDTSNPGFYKWDQWIFLKMFEKGIAYRKKAPVNWCDKCDTVLANEQVHNGKCWRHEDTEVETKNLEQWFFKITDYADELLEMTDGLNWPQRIKSMQKNWIGKSHGLMEEWQVDGMDMKLKTFTTEPHTTYGASFMVLAPEHPLVLDLVKGTKYEKKAKEFIKKCKKFRIEDPTNTEKQKEGFFLGRYVLNHLNGRKMPLYIANFAIMDYGTGIVKCTPTHDQRDYEFAKKYDLGFYPVIEPPNEKLDPKKMKAAYTSLTVGKMVDAGKFTGMDAKEAKKAVADYTVKIGHGEKTVNYKLKDWLVSRQRYWGTPIPIIYCKECGTVPVPEKDLPVELPEKVKFGKGNPLLTNEKWIKVKCPKCGINARRETDTMDTFVNSSWYNLRYCDPDNDKAIFDKKKAKYWVPIDQYIGGAEHACMHLIYFRFYTKFLRDLGLLDVDEPATSLFNQGMLHAADGYRMSKSRGNVINPIDMIKKVGTDSLRLALMSFASPDSDTNWDEKVVAGSSKFLNKVHDYFENVKIGKSDAKIESKLNKVIKEMTNQIDKFKYNLAIIKVRDLFNSLPQETSKEVLEKALKLLHPFCPHITEELWSKIGNKNFISLESWPKVEERKIDDKFDQEDAAKNKLVSDIMHILKIVKKEKVYVYVIPNELALYDEKDVSSRVGKPVKIFATNNKDKYDPTNKAKNTKPGKPGIYLE